MTATASGYLLTPLVLPLPPGWLEEKPRLLPNGVEGRIFRYRDGLTVMGSLQEHPDGQRWAHLLVGYATSRPTGECLLVVRDIFLGKEVTAFEVLRPGSDRSSKQRHLWSNLAWLGQPPPFGRAT